MFVNPLSLGELLRKVRSGDLQPAQLVHLLCDRIEAVDSRIHAFLPEPGRRERLLADLAVLEKRFPPHRERPPLFGVAVGVKDIFRVDGFGTRAGSRLPEHLFAGEEAAAVTRMKQAGALVLGKTVTTEFAWFQPGPTRNPHHTQHSPGGSSSGSAAAVAAGMCPLALGTQTIGSVSRPASYCGVFGFKPGLGRIPTDGVVPFSPTVDHVGFFSGDVETLHTVCGVLADTWRTVPVPENAVAARIGVPAGAYLGQAQRYVRQWFMAQLDRLKKVGHTVVEMDFFGDIGTINTAHRRIVARDFALVHQRWYAEYGHLYGSHAKELVTEGLAVEPGHLEAALDLRSELGERMEAAAREKGIDLWLSPAATDTAPYGLASTGSPLMNLPWTFTGMPTLAIPAGTGDRGLPLGLQAATVPGADEELLAWCRGIFGRYPAQ